jgi:hypothetical protein
MPVQVYRTHAIVANETSRVRARPVSAHLLTLVFEVNAAGGRQCLASALVKSLVP